MNTKLDKEVAKAERPHFSALDGLRGVAILLVLMRHCSLTNPRPFEGWGQTIHDNLIGSMALGVQLFFVLSGFLITGILLDSKGDRNYYINFYGRRVLRIFPLYYGTILVFGVVCLFHGFAGDDRLFLHRLPWLLTFTTNIRMTLHQDLSFIFNGHSLTHFWSLAVEEQFYLIWPLIVLRCSTGILKHICLAAIVGSFAVRMIFFYGCHNALGSYVFLPSQSDALAMGALLAIVVREREQMVAALAWPLTLTGAAIWMATLLDGNVLVTVGDSGFAMMSLGALALCLYHPISKWFANPMLRAFGKYSYGIYVLHYIILPFVWPLREKLGYLGFALFFVPLAFFAGWLSWHLFEAHFLKLKRLFPASSNQTWTPKLQFVQKKESRPVSQAV